MFFGSKNQTKKEVLQFKRKGLGNNGQHVCSANASHKWLSALLCGVWSTRLLLQTSAINGCPHFFAVCSFPTGIPWGKTGSFKAFMPMDTLHPEENGGGEADFAKQSA